MEFSLGESDTVGSKLPLEDGPIDDDGIWLSFVVGGILILGAMLGAETGSNDLDGPLVGICDGGVVMLMDGAVLPSMGLTLGVLIGDCEIDGSELTVGR